MEDSKRRVKESPVRQGASEQILYSIDTLPWGGTPANVTVKAYNEAGTDVSATILSGAANVIGNVITLPICKSTVSGHVYTIKVRWTNSGNTLEAFFDVIGED